MQTASSPALKNLREQVEAALIVAGQNARKLAEQTGTQLIVVTDEQGKDSFTDHQKKSEHRKD